MPYILAAIITLVIALPLGFFVGSAYRKKADSNEIGTAEAQAKKILEDGIKAAEAKKKEALDAINEAKEDFLKQKNDSKAEAEKREKKLDARETSLDSREATLESRNKTLDEKSKTLDKKSETLDQKSETLDQKLKAADEKMEEIEAIKTKQIEELQRVSGMTAEQAREELVASLEATIRHEQAIRMTELEAQFKEEADNKARNIVSMAIQRCAADQVADITVAVVPLPSEEMKGRIIGREGRNIRAIETLTGVDLIIDDTPEAITISCFDPVRREIARVALNLLISDGRIHPTRIEDMVEKARREVEASVKQAADEAVLTVLGMKGQPLNPELHKLLGRLKYRTSYGQNVLNHSIEVALLAGMMASELGIDPTIAKRAGLLHDIGKALTHEIEGSHVDIGVDIARKYKENRDVIHAIEAHHGDVEAQTIVAVLVQAADAISAARPGARRENLENYIKRLETLEAIAASFDGVEKTFAIQAGREIRIMVKPEVVSDESMKLVAREIVQKIEAELEYPGQIKVNLIRESRAVDFAK